MKIGRMTREEASTGLATVRAAIRSKAPGEWTGINTTSTKAFQQKAGFMLEEAGFENVGLCNHLEFPQNGFYKYVKSEAIAEEHQKNQFKGMLGGGRYWGGGLK